MTTGYSSVITFNNDRFSGPYQSIDVTSDQHPSIKVMSTYPANFGDALTGKVLYASQTSLLTTAGAYRCTNNGLLAKRNCSKIEDQALGEVKDYGQSGHHVWTIEDTTLVLRNGYTLQVVSRTVLNLTCNFRIRGALIPGVYHQNRLLYVCTFGDHI